MLIVSLGGSAVNWWERSPRDSNNNNFCNVNNNGNANNNNANNSNGLAPDFVNPATRDGSQIVVTDELDLYERRNTSRGESPKLPFDAITRTLLA